MNFLNQITNDKQFTSLSKEVQEHILKYAKLAIGINTKVANERLPLTSSKFGGTPYLASNEQIPRDKENRPYLLLVQLNFAEIKQKVGQHPQLPSEGLLQIFIPAFEENHGCLDDNYKDINGQIVRFITDFTDDMNTSDIADYNDMFYNAKDFIDKKKEIRHQNFSEITRNEPDYYKRIQKRRNDLINALPYMQKFGTPYFPLYEECELKFVPLLTREYETSRGYEDYWKELDEKQQQEEENYLARRHADHYLLGYPQGFVQYDPRELWFPYEDEIPDELKHFYDGTPYLFRSDLHLFLELSTTNMCWWDCGKAHFFIQEDDLKAFNFQNMHYYIQAS
ncbi:MAG: DUF1963 domain-containing protein [Moraxellaceae bacterium]|nr:DUF1963 domain-containing protein [Moraxellaceae bacterium]